LTLAYKLEGKGITVYRYGSKKEQVLYVSSGILENETLECTSAEPEYSGGCPLSVTETATISRNP